MRENNGARASTPEHPATPSVAPRFARAAEAERSRLRGKREQLLRKRQEAQAEVERIDRAVSTVDELLELLVPLLAGNGSEPESSGERGRADAEPGDQPQPAKE